MPSQLLESAYSAASTTNSGLTRYFWFMGHGGSVGTEATAQTVIRENTQFSSLYFRVTANTLNGDTTLRTRKNGDYGNQIVTIGAGATGAFQDLTNVDLCAPGDTFNLQMITGGDAGSISHTLISLVRSCAANNFALMVNAGGSGLSPGATVYCPLMGTSSLSATEARAIYTFRTAATLAYMRILSNSYTIDGSTTVRLRKSTGVGGYGNQTVTFNATGTYTDITNTDVISIGENVDYEAVSGGTVGAGNIASAHIVSISLAKQIALMTPATTTIAAGLTRYACLEGSSQALNATEASVQTLARIAISARNMFVNVPTNSLTADMTIKLRRSGGAGGYGTMNVTIGAGLTGTFEDLVNTDSILDTDLLDWEIVTAAGAGTAQICAIGMEQVMSAITPMKTYQVPILQAIGVS